MALYFFHLRDGEMYEEDMDGVLFPDVDTARTEAVAAAREMLSEQIALGIPIGNQVFEVCDEDGVLVFRVAFKDILHS